MFHFAPLQTSPWSTGLHALVCKLYPRLGIICRPNPADQWTMGRSTVDLEGTFCRASTLQKKGKRKVQRMPQSEIAALPRHQEEEENRQNQTSTNQTNVRKALRLVLSSPSEVITMLKGPKTQEINNTR